MELENLIKMDRNELRRQLEKIPKPDLIDLIKLFESACPDFELKFNPSNLEFKILVSNTWAIIRSMQEEYPETDYIKCLTLLAQKINRMEEEKSVRTVEIRSNATESISELQVIPFNANELCKYLSKLLKESEHFMKNWNEFRNFFGFCALLTTNAIPIPRDLEPVLFQFIFYPNEDTSFEARQLIDYSRHQLDVLEKDFKELFSLLDTKETDLILSLNLLFWEIRSLMEDSNIKINYNSDDLPLLKRVILAQCIKLTENSCSDELIDEKAEILNEIINVKIPDISINVLPWGELD
ncbi:MAG: hypothetical protein ACTSQI_16545 [Candidatus Helarchaeota archaeon]